MKNAEAASFDSHSIECGVKRRGLGVAFAATFLTSILNSGSGAPVAPFTQDGGQRTLAPGDTVAVTSAAVPGMRAINSGDIVANGVTITLGAGATIGAQTESGGTISLSGSTISSSVAGTGQHGLNALGGQITGTGTAITIGAGATTISNARAAFASGGVISLSNPTLVTLGGGNGNSNYAAMASGAGSEITLTGGTVSTLSRGSFGVLAEAGGKVTLTAGTQVTTTGVNIVASATGSHALIATGIGSEISATGSILSTSGLLASGARVESGGTMTLNGVTITTSSTASVDTDPSSGARVLSGGSMQVIDSTITTTGQRGNGFSVENAGSMATILNTTITSNGNRAPAAYIVGGGQATFTNSFLTANASTGVQVQDAGSAITLTNTAVISNAAVGYGVRVTTGASATMTGGSVTTTMRDGPGFYSSSSTITATNVTVLTSGTDNAMGALADLNGNITLNGGSITTSGDSVRVASFPHGVAARNPGGVLTANGTTITTTGFQAMGAVADDGGTTILNDNVITTSGISSLGLFATVEQNGAQFLATLTGSRIAVETSGLLAHGAVSNQNNLPARSLITLTDSTITTHGNRADGLRAIRSGTVNGSNSVVLTEGSDANGLHARDNGSSVNIDATTVTTTGAAGHGGFAESGGLLTGSNSTILASGAQASGLFVAGDPGFVSEARFTGGTITNATGATIGVAGNGRVTLTNLTAGGSGQWLKVGTLSDFPVLPAIVADALGVTDPEGTEVPPTFPLPRAPLNVPGLADVTVDGATVIGSALTLPGSVSNVTMVRSAFWEMTGDSNVTNLSIDASTVNFSAPTGPGFKILTIDNNLSGQNGLFRMNTDLRRIEGDLMFINGLGSGDHQIFVTNRGGSPTGPGQALRIVQTTDGINGAIFTLANPNRQVPAGMFIYILRLGNNQGNTPDPLAWYLVNEVTGGPGPGEGLPILSNEGRVVVNTTAVLAATWFEELSSLHQRMGELRLSVAPPSDPPDGKSVLDGKALADRKTVTAPEPASPRWDAWVRTNGRRLNAETDLGGRFHESLWGVTLGADRSFRLEDSQLWLGAFAGYSRVERDFRESGHGDTDSISAGLYGTWISDRGWYVDVVGKVNRLENNLEAASYFGEDSHSDYRNWASGVSLEVGRQFALGGDWFIEPQVQGAYTRLTKADYTTESGIQVDVDDGDVFQLRAGVLLGRKMEVGRAKLQPYVKASAVEVLSHGGRLNADGTDFHSTLDGFRFEGGVGIMAQLDGRNQIYLDYVAAAGQKVEQPWSVSAGFRHSW